MALKWTKNYQASHNLASCLGVNSVSPKDLLNDAGCNMLIKDINSITIVSFRKILGKECSLVFLLREENVMSTGLTDEYEYIFTKRITLKNGKILYPYQYGLEAFRIKVKKKRKSK